MDEENETKKDQIYQNEFNYLELSPKRLLRGESFTPLQARYAVNLTQAAMAETLDLSLRQWQYYETHQKEMPKVFFLALRYLISTIDKTRNASTSKFIRQRLKKSRENLTGKMAKHMIKKHL